MPYFLLSLLIFLTPFIINPFGEYFFEPPKVIFTQILIELLLLISLLKGRSIFNSLNKYHLSLSVALVFLTIFHVLSNWNLQSFMGNEIRLQGVFLLWHLLVFSLISSRFNMKNLPNVLFPVGIFFLLLTTIVVEGDINNRAIGTLGEANALASTALLFWPFACLFNLKGDILNKIFKLIVPITALIIIALSKSASGYVGFLIQLTFLLSLRFISLKKGLALACVLIIFSLILPFYEGGGWYENRAEIWKTAFYSGTHSILGHGFGNIEQALSESSNKLENNIRFQSVDSAHNILLDFWVQGGIVGLGALVFLIYLSIRNLSSQVKIIQLTAFLGLFTALLFNPTSVANLIYFWWLIGQGFAIDKDSTIG